MKPLLEAARFGCVGGVAMLAHLGVVSCLVPAGLHPLSANVAGFLLAFQVSFLGHRGWTFRSAPRPGQYVRMFAVSSAGFAFNEALYALLLATGFTGYRTALFLVLLTVAGGTYFLSRFWVFRSPA